MISISCDLFWLVLVAVFILGVFIASIFQIADDIRFRHKIDYINNSNKIDEFSEKYRFLRRSKK